MFGLAGLADGRHSQTAVDTGGSLQDGGTTEGMAHEQGRPVTIRALQVFGSRHQVVGIGGQMGVGEVPFAFTETRDVETQGRDSCCGETATDVVGGGQIE